MRRSYPQALRAILRESPSDVGEFVWDIIRALPHGPRHLRNEMVAWHHTVQVWQDAEQLEALRGPYNEADYVEVFPPGMIGHLVLADAWEAAELERALEEKVLARAAQHGTTPAS